MVLLQAITVDGEGQLVRPDDPDAVLQETFAQRSDRNVPAGIGDYTLAVVQVILTPPPEVEPPLITDGLPEPSEALAELLEGATFWLYTDVSAQEGASGTITSTAAIPEPATALLFAGGLGALAAGRGRRPS